jgi:hypothetical protein
MNSIDDKALRAVTDPLFDALTADGVGAPPPFPMGPDPRLSSYYIQRTQTTMGRADFLAPSCLDAGEFARCMEAHWRAEGRPDLAAWAPQLAEAARALHALYTEAEPEAEVSPYIYQMF